MKKTLICLGILLLYPLAGAADTPPAELLGRIAAHVEQHAVVRAEFVQTKQVAAMKRPLVSSGRLVYSRQHGVLWQIEQPYRMTYVLDELRMIEIGADGNRRERNVRDLPGMAQVGRVFRAMLGANTTTLREYFDIKAQGEPARWEIALQPRQAQMAQFIEGLQINGGQFITSIRINEAGGDKTVIQLRNPVATATPDAAELLLYTGAAARP